MNNKNIFIGVASVIAVFLVIFFAYKITNVPAKIEFPEINTIRATDHVKWKKDSKNILIEYSDYQCPSCKSFHDFLKTVEKTATPDAAFVFKDFPLYQIHPLAFSAAYAAEAAHNQGKYFEMGDLLFEKQAEWSKLQDTKKYFTDLAQSLELDIEKFKSDLESKTTKDNVQNDLTEGEKIGVNSTPTFFLNGRKVEVATFDEFKKLLLSL
ncbi:MAG: DSBA oxidoreductase [Candidatus Roizmanbacteria bacterium GW2011_GWA2_35_19]|uniref:DSBA oxidoreductase n=2 Tax=Candidatus Roizmaniibacteriota TaxID=1752723 RepID=A0A0G0BTP8_9BACT|nr:MAG: DSBA oxidoreductase [Candidatus Roizmanbacteria bacterium GW2011_GWC2_35_12]KKP72834.1 MAG: DSBA oxidoreductase [Candidatus Roizmanbacteria bacterium GW2011_GWA2_35_19]